MKKQLKSIAVSASSILSLLAITFTTAAAPPAAVGSADLASVSNPGAANDRPAAACTAMEADEVYWVTLTEDGEIDETVESYPDETTKVTAAFDYNCVPKKTKLLAIWSIDGEQVLTDEASPKASTKGNTWTNSIFMKDESPLPNGEYAIEYYVGEDLLTSGTIIVGEESPDPDPDPDPEPDADVTVEGTVVDAKSKKPINGALVIVLNEEVDAEAWLEDGSDEDVFAFAKTDSKGRFELDNRVPTGVAHPWLIGAKGYRTILEQEFAIEEGVDDPYVLNIALERQK